MFQTSSMSEKLCLKWNDFQENVNAAFGNLREDNEFADVTLAFCLQQCAQFFIRAHFCKITGTFLEKIRAKSQKYRRYTGNFPQMPVYTGASVFIRATWAHCFRSEIMLFSTNVCVYGRARIYKGYWFM